MSTKRSEPIAEILHTDAGAAWALDERRVPIFSVRKPYVPTGEEEPDFVAPDDEIVTYTMPAKPNPGIALRFLKKAREQGDVASSWLIETAIGAEGYDALADELINYEGDPVALLQQIAQKIQTVVMGGLDAGPKA